MNRGGTMGQEGEISGQRDRGQHGGMKRGVNQGMNRGNEQGNLNRRDHERQQGGQGREPNLERGGQPRHISD